MQPFDLNDVEEKTAEVFKQEQQKLAIADQQEKIQPDDPDFDTYYVSWEMGFPYMGPIGGQFSYRFTPTSIGHTVVIIDNYMKVEKNITDFSCW